MTRRRELTPAEIELWRRAMAEREPLDGTPAAKPPPAVKMPARTTQVAHAPAALDPQRPIGLDRRSWLRLRRGQVVIDESIDLHGLTQEQAHEQLGRFLGDAQARGLRCLLVVTGKGLVHGGVLRHMVPRWLNEGANRARVLAYAPAQPKHGGAGALYLLIRRKR
ncbi:MAG TPA: Smr/MutS family protein [Geminicoccaceae bacterium]|nr:Smr/MutS family protein [Geminicoccaceae bacterium]